jgi:hypothetical protein
MRSARWTGKVWSDAKAFSLSVLRKSLADITSAQSVKVTCLLHLSNILQELLVDGIFGYECIEYCSKIVKDAAVAEGMSTVRGSDEVGELGGGVGR